MATKKKEEGGARGSRPEGGGVAVEDVARARSHAAHVRRGGGGGSCGGKKSSETFPRRRFFAKVKGFNSITTQLHVSLHPWRYKVKRRGECGLIYTFLKRCALRFIPYRRARSAGNVGEGVGSGNRCVHLVHGEPHKLKPHSY